MEEKIGIVAFAFGTGPYLLSNEHIKDIALKKALEENALIFTQFDSGIESASNVTFVTEKEGCPPSTLRMAVEGITWAIEKGITHLYVVAAKPHYRRCLFDLFNEKVIKEIEIEDLDIFLSIVEEISEKKQWYCRESTQARTRSALRWWLREIPLRILMICCYPLYRKITY